MKATGSPSLADLIQAFFRRHLIATRGVSPHTLHAYRDAIRGLLTFAAARCSRSVVELSVDDLGRDAVLGIS
jgi:integrase/recombinase XerD